MKQLPALLAAMILLLSCCAAPESPAAKDAVAEDAAVCESQLFAMDTYMTLRAYGSAAPSALAEATSLIRTLDAALSAADEGSEIAAVNRSAEPVTVSDDTAALLSRALELSGTLNGALSLTLSPVIRAWGFVSRAYRVPGKEEIAGLLKQVDDTKIQLEGNTVTTPEGTELDLGAVAKGYAADRAAALLQERGVSACILNLGGSTIRTVGTKPDGSLWRIAIRDPKDEEHYAGTLLFGEGAVDTSGGYERFFEGEDGEIYWHILDPATGYPARSGLVSVTVLTGDACTGDALSTALFVMGAEDAVAFWQTRRDFEFVFLTETDDILLSEGVQFTPQGRYADAPITVIRHETDP